MGSFIFKTILLLECATILLIFVYIFVVGFITVFFPEILATN